MPDEARAYTTARGLLRQPDKQKLAKTQGGRDKGWSESETHQTNRVDRTRAHFFVKADSGLVCVPHKPVHKAYSSCPANLGQPVHQRLAHTLTSIRGANEKIM